MSPEALSTTVGQPRDWHGCGGKKIVKENAPHNPYAPPGGDPPLLQRAEAAVDVADDTLDDLDALMERAVY